MVVNRTPDAREHASIVHTQSRKFRLGREAQVAQASPNTSNTSPMYPTLRANPFPEVTDLFCRLPLSTLFYQLEAVNKKLSDINPTLKHWQFVNYFLQKLTIAVITYQI